LGACCRPTLALEGCIFTIDAMGAQAIRDRQAQYLLAVKDTPLTLAEAICDFFLPFKAAAPHKPPHDFHGSLDKGHRRIEQRRCFSVDQLECLPNPGQWPGLPFFFTVIESARTIRAKTSLAQRCYV
jgi:hypothetical protein